MTTQQYDATMQSFVIDYRRDLHGDWRGSLSEEELDAMYRSRCKASGINYADFVAKRDINYKRNEHPVNYLMRSEGFVVKV